MSEKSAQDNYRNEFFEMLKEVEDTYYKPQEIPTIRRFIENYNLSDSYSEICFSWNGRTDQEYKDFNLVFRDKVSIYICLNDIRASPELLRDLIQECGKSSQNSWGAPEHLFVLSEKLLKETGAKYIEDFGKMLFSNMDTYGACLSIDFKDIDVKGILHELNLKEPKNKLILDLIEYFATKQ